MFFVDTLGCEGLGNRSYLAGGPHAALVIDPPRDINQVIAAAARRGVRIAFVAETHVHNDYIPAAWSWLASPAPGTWCRPGRTCRSTAPQLPTATR